MADGWALDDQEIARIDALYRPFPSFAEWVASSLVDEAEWASFERLLRERREAVAAEELGAALNFVMRAAAMDTGAIEGLYTTDRGFTFTVAQQALHWERELAEQGELAVELFQAQLRTYELVLDAATDNVPITEAWIRRLHEELCAPQATYEVHTPVGIQRQPLPKGEYKHHPNHVRLPNGEVHAYAPVDRVRDEMHRLVEELSSPEFAAAHPVHQASYAHYALAVTHPFADGNGRVSRALASTFFYRALSIPLVVLYEQRTQYLDALEAADAGEAQPFVSFVAECGIETVQLVFDSLEMAAAPGLETAASELNGLLSGFAHRVEMDQIATALLSEWVTVVHKAISETSMPTAVEANIKWASVEQSPPVGFRGVPRDPTVVIRLELRQPATVNRFRAFNVFVSVNDDEPWRFLIVDQSGSSRGVRLREASPIIAPALRVRLEQWARTVIAEMLVAITEQARQSLEQ